MRKHTRNRLKSSAAALHALALCLGLAGCIGGAPTNRSMYSQHQPVVSQSDYALDLRADGAGLSYGEEERLAGWFAAMGLKYGDRIVVDDPSASPATMAAIAAAAQRHGLAVDEQASQPTGMVPGGMARVTISRAKAAVPGCPDWRTNSDANPNNGLSSNFGCAINANMAAMVANPQDLISGSRDTGSTGVMTSNKAIGAYRSAPPTGNGSTVSTTGTKGN